MRAVSWVAVKLSRLFLVIGGLSALALLVGFVTWVFGGSDYPAPFTGESGTSSGFGEYAWQVGAMTVGSWLLWQLCVAFVVRGGVPRDVYRAMGRDDEWHEPENGHQRLLALVAAGRCRACGTEFQTWDDALDHAEQVHGQDRTPEEARALLERLD